MIVAIDGPAGVGKTTISQKIAKETKFFFVSSGEFYRAVACLFLKEGLTISSINEDLVYYIIKNNHLQISEAGKPIASSVHFSSNDLHNEQVDKLVSLIAKFSKVRLWINQMLKDWSVGRDLIVEGRDMSTVVFPDAELKVFLDADIEERAKRRALERNDEELKNIKEAIKERDLQDKNNLKEQFSLQKGTLYLDTSGLTIVSVCENILVEIDRIKKVINS